MLTREHRLSSSQLFSRTVRRGRRTGTRTLVVHLDVEGDVPRPQVGLVVSKAVGGAVTRNVVKRRLRHLIRERIDTLPASGVLVVRALPSAATADYRSLAADLDHALSRATARGREQPDRGVASGPALEGAR